LTCKNKKKNTLWSLSATQGKQSVKQNPGHGPIFLRGVAVGNHRYLRIIGVSAEIRTGHLPNASEKPAH
jgi:hypothetical protein